jgi:hypothetical protein
MLSNFLNAIFAAFFKFSHNFPHQVSRIFCTISHENIDENSRAKVLEEIDSMNAVTEFI